MITKQRLSLLGLGVIAVVTAWAALALFAAAWAHADVVVGDPLATATSATSDGMALIRQYGPIWGGALLLWGSVSLLLRTNESKHWLAEGRTLAILTGAASVLGAVLEWRLNGGQLAGIVVTAIMALKLALQPAVKAGPSTVIIRNVTGPAALIVGAITFAAVFATPSCAEVRPRVAAATEAFVDCELPALKVAATEAYELAEAALLSTISGTGSVDSAALKRALVGIKSDGLRCAVAAAVAGIAVPANQPQGLMAARSDATGMQAAYATVSGELGWPTYRVGPP